MVEVSRHRVASGRLLLLVGASGLVAVALIVLALAWAGSESDAAALERQRSLVNARLQDQVTQVRDLIGKLGESHARLQVDDAAAHQAGSADAADGQRRDGNDLAFLRRAAIEVFGFDRAFIANRDGLIATANEPSAQNGYRWIKPLLKPLWDEAGKNGKAQPVRPGESGTEGRATARLMRLEGRPSIVALAPVAGVAADSAPASSAAAPSIVVVRYLDGSALDKLSRDQGLAGARYARSADADGNEVSFQVDDSGTGEPIGFIIWTPDLPGSIVIHRLVPALSIATLMFAALFGALVILLRKSLSELNDSEEHARHLANHDVLTQLPNRALFTARLEEGTRQARGQSVFLAVALVDLDRFKAVNDTHGHAAGDELIRQAAKRMSDQIGSGDTLARLGGDEFAIIFHDKSPLDERVGAICRQIIQALEQPFILDDTSAASYVSASVGIAFWDKDTVLPDELLRKADLALYEAKRQGRARSVLFDSSLGDGKSDADALQRELRILLAQSGHARAGHNSASPEVGSAPEEPNPSGALELHYQAVFREDDGWHVSGAEALVRWRHPERGLIAPDRFIPMAEESGLIHEIGRWVLRRACIDASAWPSDIPVAVNVSPVQLRHSAFVSDVERILRETGFPATRLEIEVTESALIGGSKDAARTLEALRAMGIKIALDDFGTGYSSLSHLLRFEVDRIKIDRSFVSRLGRSAEATSLISSIIQLGRSLGIMVTAEGIELESQRDFLVAVGCTDLQGFLFSKPSPLHENGCLDYDERLPQSVSNGPDRLDAKL